MPTINFKWIPLFPGDLLTSQRGGEDADESGAGAAVPAGGTQPLLDARRQPRHVTRHQGHVQEVTNTNMSVVV